MSDSMHFPEEGQRERGVKRLLIKVTFGSSSVSASAGSGGTVTRTAAGTYTLTLDDTYVEFRSMPWVLDINSTTPSDLVLQPYSISMSGKTVKFKLLTGTTATDPASGAVLYLEPTFKDTGVTY